MSGRSSSCEVVAPRARFAENADMRLLEVDMDTLPQAAPEKQVLGGSQH